MNIVHFTYGRVNPVSANGVNYVILNLSRALRSAGHDVRVVSFSRKDTTPTTLDRDGLPVEVYPDPMSGSLRGLTAIVERLETLRRRGELDVLHLHLAWHIHKVPIVRWALRSGVPYTVTTHCGYTQDRIAHHGWRKKLALAYLLLAGDNDADEELRAFGERCKRLDARVHLYAYNPVASSSQEGVSRSRYEALYARLHAMGLNVRMSSKARTEALGGCGTLVGIRRSLA